MEIVEGFIALVFPGRHSPFAIIPVTICPYEDGWGYGKHPTDDNPKGIVEKHFAKTVEAGKLWASRRVANLQGVEFSADEPGPELPWESLICNPRD